MRGTHLCLCVKIKLSKVQASVFGQRFKLSVEEMFAFFALRQQAKGYYMPVPAINNTLRLEQADRWIDTAGVARLLCASCQSNQPLIQFGRSVSYQQRHDDFCAHACTHAGRMGRVHVSEQC